MYNWTDETDNIWLNTYKHIKQVYYRIHLNTLNSFKNSPTNKTGLTLFHILMSLYKIHKLLMVSVQYTVGQIFNLITNSHQLLLI